MRRSRRRNRLAAVTHAGDGEGEADQVDDREGGADAGRGAEDVRAEQLEQALARQPRVPRQLPGPRRVPCAAR